MWQLTFFHYRIAGSILLAMVQSCLRTKTCRSCFLLLLVVLALVTMSLHHKANKDGAVEIIVPENSGTCVMWCGVVCVCVCVGGGGGKPCATYRSGYIQQCMYSSLLPLSLHPRPSLPPPLPPSPLPSLPPSISLSTFPLSLLPFLPPSLPPSVPLPPTPTANTLSISILPKSPTVHEGHTVQLVCIVTGTYTSLPSSQPLPPSMPL